MQVVCHIMRPLVPDGSMPHMIVGIKGKIGWLEEHKTHPEIGPLIRSLLFVVGQSVADWAGSLNVCSSQQAG